MDWLAFAAAVVTAVGAFFGTYISNRKQTVLVAYRLEELEKKVNKHNNLIERMYKAEGQIAELQHDVSEIKAKG
jgi:hypothetical protein